MKVKQKCFTAKNLNDVKDNMETLGRGGKKDQIHDDLC